MPRILQVAIRRWRAGRIRDACADVWPIDQNAGARPPGWPGWPGGKQFALVLTHDVEGRKGLARVKPLMELELSHGLRSSFNFVPEGGYRVPDELRRTLSSAGFEVGVHGLKHDAKLYASKAEFANKAARIAKYVESWNAQGFRSPSMQHRLSWLHALGVRYDASTFDTDPFEPEPDGVETVFPFWVPGAKGAGYVELPYTLPQDFTLFVLLREPNPDIWKRKLDWVAARGGLALLITHPDYMSFGGSSARDEYPAAFYEDFLEYLRRRYEGAFWAARPCDIASYYTKALPPESRNTRKKVCILSYSSYEAGTRIRGYADALAKRGDRVDVIALGPRERRTIDGAVAYGVQQRGREERSKWTNAGRLVRFLLQSSVILARMHRQVRYDLVHLHNFADFSPLAAWYPKLTGAKVILDLPVLGRLVYRFRVKEKHPYAIRLRCSVACADHVIVSNHLWHDRLVSRSIPREKLSVYLDDADPAAFHRRSVRDYLDLVDSLTVERFGMACQQDPPGREAPTQGL